jgi:hypothetical protein
MWRILLASFLTCEEDSVLCVVSAAFLFVFEVELWRSWALEGGIGRHGLL